MAQTGPQAAPAPPPPPPRRPRRRRPRRAAPPRAGRPRRARAPRAPAAPPRHARPRWRPAAPAARPVQAVSPWVGTAQATCTGKQYGLEAQDCMAFPSNDSGWAMMRSPLPRSAHTRPASGARHLWRARQRGGLAQRGRRATRGQQQPQRRRRAVPAAAGRRGADGAQRGARAAQRLRDPPPHLPQGSGLAPGRLGSKARCSSPACQGTTAAPWHAQVVDAMSRTQ